MAPERPAGSPRAANYFLNLVTDSPPIRHSCEKFVILFENLHASCRFPILMADDDAFYLRLCGILIEMANAFFSSSWRIL